MRHNFYTNFKVLLLISLIHFQVSSQNNVLHFDGVNDYVNLNVLQPSMLSNSDHFTIEFKMKADFNAQNDVRTAMFAINHPTGENRLLMILGGVSTQTGRLLIQPNPSDNGGQTTIYESTEVIGDNQCHHIAYTYDGINNIGKVYIDGILKSTHTFVCDITVNDRYSLGQEYDNALTSQFYNGILDDVRIWSVIRTDSEITTNQNTVFVGNELGLMALYTCNQGVAGGNNLSQTTLIDATANNLNGTLTNFTLTGLTSNFIQNDCNTSSQGLQSTFNTTINTICNGDDCNYTGPSILINELMISPTAGDLDGSMSGLSSVGDPGFPPLIPPTPPIEGKGEWIELYNPNICEPVDISCYYLGNNTPDGAGGFVIPPNIIIPPGGFCLIRGSRAAAVPANRLVQNGGNVVEIVVPVNVTDPGVCAGGHRLWFPNAGGWFAFYDRNGVPQDAVSWGNQSSISGVPCIANFGGCTSVSSLPSYNNIPADRKNFIGSGALEVNRTFRRIPDGEVWASGQANPTMADCNSTCATLGTSSCDGTATINVTGGTAPYSYSWDDSQAQLTQTAVGLCAGTYTCTVTDDNGDTQSFQVEIVDFVPTVTMSVLDEICIDGAAVSLAGTPQPTGGANGVFSGAGVTGTTFSPAVAQAGQHTITYTYTDENGCENSASDNIIVNPLPVVAINNVANPYCVEVQTASLQLSPTGGQLSGTGVSSNQFSPSTAGVGTYTLTYEYTDANGCENSTTASVQVVQAAEPTITVPVQLCIDANAVNIQVNPAGGQFQINGNNASLSFLPQDYGTGMHTLTYSYFDANNCIGATSETINVYGLPVITLALNAVYCYESGFVSVNPQPAGGTFTGDNVVGGGLNITSVNPGVYTVHYELTDAFGCYAEQTRNYTVSTPFDVGFQYEVDCFQQFSGVASPVNANYQYHWDFGTFETNAPPSFSHYFTEFGTYILTLSVTDQHGCVYDTVGIVDVPKGVTLSDFVVPNVITPNGDGVNDYLAMPVLLDECFTYKILITNRWGNVVFEMDNQAAIFDGRNKNGNELTEGVYFYQVVSDDFDCNDPELKGFCSGFITIVR